FGFVIRCDVDRIVLLGPGREPPSGAEYGIVLEPESETFRDFARGLQYDFELRGGATKAVGQIPSEQDVAAEQPFRPAVAHDDAQLGRPSRFGKLLFLVRKLG